MQTCYFLHENANILRFIKLLKEIAIKILQL